jgi:peptidoglycan/LPS O-acetylase OafA/YrhL
VRLKYQPELDGLRALSALAVVAFHVGVPWLPNGRVGVPVFFVLSGYLITSLLNGGMSPGEFYERRARRLIPGYLFFLLVIYATALLLWPDWNALPSILWSALYLSDYGMPYFGMWRGLGHTWSLAVEMQFYLLWPFVLRYGRKEWIVWLFLGALAMRFGSYALTHHWRGTYMTLHGNSAGLLLGSLVALYRDEIRPREWMAWAGGAIVLLAAMAPRDSFEQTLCLITFAEVGTAALMVGLWSYGSLNRLLASDPLVWLGKRSYGFYLWHLPIVLALQPVTVWPNSNWLPAFVLSVALSLALAGLSYAYIEEPFRTSGSRRVRSWFPLRNSPYREAP